MISSFRQDIDNSLNPSCLVQLLAETNSRPFKKRVTHHNKFLPSGLLKDARYLGRLLAIIRGVVQLVRDLNQIRLLINPQQLKNNLELVPQRIPQGHPRSQHSRSEERRVGKEGVSTCNYRWSP